MWRVVAAALLAATPACASIFGLDEAVGLEPADGPSGTVTIGGTVNGLLGAGLVLQDNGGDAKMIVSNGSFQFPTPLPAGTVYTITIAAQPSNPTQLCSLVGQTGTATADVTTIEVTCTTSKFAIGGTVSGLVAPGLTLQDNATDDLQITAPAFDFSTPLASGTTYTVTIKTQPSNQTCVAFGATGTVGAGPVSSVLLNCSASDFAISGMVTGLNGTVTLKQGGDTVVVSSNGGFGFPTLLQPGQTYNVTVASQPAYPPASQTCTVTNGAGVVGTANVTNVAVSCVTN